MGVLNEKVTAVLQQAFPAPAQVELRDDDGIIGLLISDKFKGMGSMERQDMVWDVLNKALTPEEKRQILTIVVITPVEYIGHTSAV